MPPVSPDCLCRSCIVALWLSGGTGGFTPRGLGRSSDTMALGSGRISPKPCKACASVRVETLQKPFRTLPKFPRHPLSSARIRTFVPRGAAHAHAGAAGAQPPAGGGRGKKRRCGYRLLQFGPVGWQRSGGGLCAGLTVVGCAGGYGS